MAREWKAIGGVGTLGIEVVLSILFGLFAGKWLDTKLHSGPYLALVGFLFGTAAAVRAMVRTWKLMRAEALREEREQGNPAPLFDEPRKQRDHEPNERPVQDEQPVQDDAAKVDESAHPSARPSHDGD